MIHRFVDLLPAGCIDAPRSIIWNIRRVTGGTTRTFAVGGCQNPHTGLAEYLGLPEVSSSSFSLDYPFMSPDLVWYVYTKFDTIAPLDATKLIVAPMNDTSPAIDEIAISPVTGTTTGSNRLMIPIGWSPDSEQVYYLAEDNATDDDIEIRRVDRDGTNDTLILATSINATAPGSGPKISHDGTMIAYAIDQDDAGNQGLWVMNEDGTNNTRIYTASAFNSGQLDFFGWSRDDEWLLFTDQSGSPITRTTTMIHPDGTGLTHLFSDTVAGGNLFEMRPKRSSHSPFTPDGDYVVVERMDFLNTVAPTPGFLATDGSESFTASLPLVGNLLDGPILNYNGSRAYWAEGAAAAVQRVVSSELDGSDYRIDDDMTDTSTTPQHDDYVFNGFFKRTG